jgi:hypothetical protein
MAGNPHGANRFSNYRQIHETVMNKFKSRDFVFTDTLEFADTLYGIRLRGEIACLGKIVITVDKFLDNIEGSGDSALVQTRWYSYNASVSGRHNIHRYDNQDADFLRPGHEDEHHKHVYDWQTGKEMPGSPYWIGEDNWLNLGEFLQVTQDWYWSHRDTLPYPDEYPDLTRRRGRSTSDAE